MPAENYRDESIIWADPNATRSWGKASLNNWKETATGQNIPRAQRSEVSLSPLLPMGGATFRSAWGTRSRSWAVQAVLQILSHFCWWAVRVPWASSLQPPVIHSVMSPTHVPDVVRASILTDYSISELIGQEKTGYGEGGMMQKARR